MTRSSLSKIFVALSLALILTVPALSAAERRGPAHRASNLWSLLARSWAKIGCTIDPSGRCVSVPAAAEIGCTIDPNGRRCAPAPAAADIGCGIDPSGRCASTQ